MKNVKNLLSLSVVFFAASISLRAQSAPTAVQQQENFQQNNAQQQSMLGLKAGTNAPEIYPGEDADVGPQHILKLVPRRTYFEVKADSEYFYTDNALLSQHPTISSTLFVNTISAAFAPTPYKLGYGRSAPSVGVMSQWYNYGLGGHDLSALDFNVQTFFVAEKYLLPNNWIIFGEFDYDRFLSQNNYREFYHDFTPVVGVQRLAKICDNTVLAVGLKTDYHASWTSGVASDSEDRMDDALSASLSYQVIPQLVVQPYYRFQYTCYRFNTAHTSGRSDFLNSFGLAVAYYFTPNFSLRVFANDDIKETDDSLAPKYRAYSVGADLAYTIQF